MTTTMIRPVAAFADDLDDLWNGPEPDPDPAYVDPIKVERVLRGGEHGNPNVWRTLTYPERDEVVRQGRQQNPPMHVTVIAELLHVGNRTVRDIIDRLFNPEWRPPVVKATRTRAERDRDRTDKRINDFTTRPGIPVLTFRRPWPHLILEGGKRVENRTWSTNYRGPLYVHAGHGWDAAPPWFGPAPDPRHPIGIVGLVDVVGMCRDLATCRCGPWAIPGQWHWQLKNPQPFPTPIRWVGKLGLRWPTPEQTQMIEETRNA